MNLQSENVWHFLYLLWLKQFQFFWKFKTDRTAFFQKSRSEKISFFENFPSKIIVNKLWTKAKNPQVLQHQLCLLSEKTIFKGAWESPNLRSRNNRKKVAISGNFRSGRLPNIVLSSVSVTKLILGNTISFVMNGNFFAQYVLLGACKTGIG